MLSASVAKLTIEDFPPCRCFDQALFEILSAKSLSLVLLSGTRKKDSAKVINDNPSSVLRLYSAINCESRSGLLD